MRINKTALPRGVVKPGATKSEVVDLLSSLKLVLFAGKGGVGKTTLAVSLALCEAFANPGKKILLVSLDPAHSLALLFGEEIRPAVAGVALSGVSKWLDGRLWEFSHAANLILSQPDFSQLAGVFQDLYGAAIESVAAEGTLLDKEEVSSFVDISMPAVGELMGLLAIADLIGSNACDQVILDTAPTGHMLRMLHLPSFLKCMTEALSMMESRHEMVVSSLVGRYKESDDNLVIESLVRQADCLADCLSDEKLTGVVVATLAEHLALKETERLILSLNEEHLPVAAILINAMEGSSNCSFCLSRLKVQAPYLAALARTFAGLHHFVVPLGAGEPRSTEALRRLLSDSREYFLVPGPAQADRDQAGAVSSPARAMGHLPDFIDSGCRLLIFAGKGGVGKTTIACASAWYLAGKHEEKSILLASIDPAHSAGDCLGEPLSGKPSQLSGNLWAVEIDSKVLLAEFRKTYQAEMNDLLSRLLVHGKADRGVEMAVDAEIIERLLDMDTPDLNEFMTLRRISQLSGEGKYDLVIIDPAPAGHFLRFLQLPELARAWIKATLGVTKKHGGLKSCPALVAELISLMHGIDDFQAIMRDPHKTEIVAVATPRKIALAGACEMIERLDQHGAGRNIVINMVRTTNDECSFCQRVCAYESQQIRRFREKLSDLNIVKLPIAEHEIRQGEALAYLGEALYG